MKLIAATFAIFAVLMAPFSYGQNEQNDITDAQFWSEVSDLSKKAGGNYCFMLIRNNSDRQVALNRFRISPSEACECTASEATQAMSASPLYLAHIQTLVNSMEKANGRPPRYKHGREQDAAIEEYSRTFDQSWANCFMRLKRN